ncbi:hypothetical protein [Micromonospora globbae]|uniref:hypothetical protein n=1 Tax=Micromonospora globbae TaxID=1894969 RepID=UPI00386AE0C6
MSVVPVASACGASVASALPVGVAAVVPGSALVRCGGYAHGDSPARTAVADAAGVEVTPFAAAADVAGDAVAPAPTSADAVADGAADSADGGPAGRGAVSLLVASVTLTS